MGIPTCQLVKHAFVCNTYGSDGAGIALQTNGCTKNFVEQNLVQSHFENDFA